jgi:hypothetical protein
MKLRWWKTAQEKAAEFKSIRDPQPDDVFLAECALPPTEYARRVALTVRRSVAEYGMVDPLYIRADDRYPEQLSALSGWDSLDFLDWRIRFERELGLIVPREAWRTIEGPGFSVRQLIQTILNLGPLDPIRR